MRVRAFFGRFAPCVGALFAAATAGCGSDSSGAICDVDFGTIAGSYSFSWTTHDSRYVNSCFDNYDSPDPPDPAKLTNCTWSESPDEETFTLELTISDDGNIGNAKITSASDNVDDDITSIGVKCEMTGDSICDSPVRCNITGEKCSVATTGDPDAWKYACNCMGTAGTPNDPASQVCQQCKTEYDKYTSEQADYCQKGKDGDYVEFTLHVKE